MTTSTFFGDDESDNEGIDVLLEDIVLSGGEPKGRSRKKITKNGVKHEHGRDEDSVFDMMQVTITIYGLNGVLCHTKEKKKKRKFSVRSAGKSKSGNKKKGESPIVGSPDTPSSLACDFGLSKNDPPTTAVISFMRHAFSSGTAMETYLPSLPLKKQSRTESRTLRYNATWAEGPGFDPLGESQHVCTCQMIRVMKRQPYRPDTKAVEVSTYIHETVDLCVFVGRSKELVPLGVATLVITGDEEAEVVLNIPVKQPQPGSSAFDKHFKTSKSKRRKKKNRSFSQNPRQLFGLDDNASLRIGLRILPQKTVNEANARAAMNRAKDDAFEEILEGLFKDNVFLEMDDEDTFIQKLVGKGILQEQFDTATKDSMEASTLPHRPPIRVDTGVMDDLFTPGGATTMQSYFCGGIQFWQAPFDDDAAAVDMVSPGAESRGNVPKRVVAREKNRDVILPLSLVSSVSETITTVATSP